MGLFLAYTLKVAICLLFFYIFNKLLLSRDTFHIFNRIAWLIVVAASLLLPLFRWQGFEVESVAMEFIPADFDYSAIVTLPAKDNNTIFLIVKYSLIIYALFATAIIIKLAISYIRLFMLILPRKNNISQQKDNLESLKHAELLDRCKNIIGYRGKVHFIVHEREISPFSWMNYIVVSKQDLDNNGRDILIHELSHVKSRHSWDLIIADLLTVFQWFNPAAWLYKQSLQQVHEYTADESVIEAGVDAKEYQLLLIKKAVGQRLYSMANSFNHSKLKNRITMMLKEKSSNWALAKCLYALPLAAFAISAFASPKISDHFEDISSVKVIQNSDIEDVLLDKNDKSAEIVPDSLVFVVVEKMPKFLGGDLSEFRNWVMKQVKYPKNALISGIEGRVFATFIIEKDGTLKNIKIVETPDKSLGDEVVRILDSSPKWTAGMQRGQAVRVTYTIPVEFKLSPNTKQEKKEEMPKFLGGGIIEFSNWVMSQVRYPKKALESGVEGKVLIKFDIEKDGTLANTEIVDNPDNSLSEEALRVVELSPKWTPGTKNGKAVRVAYTIPVEFRLTPDSKQEEKMTEFVVAGIDDNGVINGTIINIRDGKSSVKKPLVILDGLKYDGNMFGIGKDRVESVTMLKPEVAIGTYGEAAKNGVILVNLKKESNKPKFMIPPSSAGQPLFIIDGVEHTGTGYLDSIDPENVASISVLKDESSISKYGEKGKNGVIIVTLKDKTKE